MTFIFCFGLPRDGCFDVNTLSRTASGPRHEARQATSQLPWVSTPSRGGTVVARITVPKLESSSFKGWTFVLIAGVVLALLAIIDRGGLGALPTATGTSACQLEVTTDQLNVRNGPSEGAALVTTLNRGTHVDGTRVVTDGYRQMQDGRWALDQYLLPVT